MGVTEVLMTTFGMYVVWVRKLHLITQIQVQELGDTRRCTVKHKCLSTFKGSTGCVEAVNGAGRVLLCRLVHFGLFLRAK